MVEVIVRDYSWETKVQWLADEDTCWRFFPAEEDEQFGFRLHAADNAVNKILCAANRRTAARDAIDLITIAQSYCSLAPLIWAAAGKKGVGRNPFQLVQDMRKICFGYSDEELRTVRTEGAEISRDEVRAVLAKEFEEAVQYFEDDAPTDFEGCLFTDVRGTPAKATEQDIESQTMSVHSIQDFSSLVSFPGQAPAQPTP